MVVVELATLYLLLNYIKKVLRLHLQARFRTLLCLERESEGNKGRTKVSVFGSEWVQEITYKI